MTDQDLFIDIRQVSTESVPIYVHCDARIGYSLTAVIIAQNQSEISSWVGGFMGILFITGSVQGLLSKKCTVVALLDGKNKGKYTQMPTQAT